MARHDVSFWFHLCLFWALFALSEFGLNLLIWRSGLRNEPLSWWFHAGLFAFDLTALAVFVLILGGPLVGLSHLARRTGGGMGWLIRLLGIFLAWFLLLAYGAHWATFYTTGQFLSIEGFAFWIDQPVQVLHWINLSAVIVIVAAGLPAAVFLTALLPRLLKHLSPVLGRRLTGAGFVAVLFCLLGTTTAEVYFGGDRMVEPIGAEYAARRDYKTGPFAFAASRFRSRDGSRPRHYPADGAIRVIRRPLISMDDYLDQVEGGSKKGWNVILILVESLRADQLEAYGATRNVMPSVNEMAATSRVFTDHYTQASHSNYADLGPLSSHYPLRSRTAHSYPPNPSYPRVLIYDVLKALGYRTAIVSSQNEHWGSMINYLDTGNLDLLFHAQSFDGPTYVMLEDIGFSGWVKQTKHAGSIDDRFTVSEAIRWIEASHSAPFFVYMNLQNSHVPYVVPEGFPRPFGPDQLDFDIFFGSFPRDKVETVKDLYADSLFYVDSQISRLIDYLRSNDLWEKTVVVVSSDTGQAFFEHGFAAHANELYNEVMEVPLLIHAPGLEPGTDPRPAQHIDVPPTILDLLGLPPHPAFQGVSLLPPDADARRSLYLVVHTPMAYQYAVVRAGLKLIYDEMLGRYLLFDQVNDPQEKRNLAVTRSEDVRRLAGRLHRWVEEQVEYYSNKSRHQREYPPVLADP